MRSIAVMKHFFVFTLIVCFTFAEPGWNPASTYIYHVLSQSYVTTEIPSTVYQGVTMKGILQLQTGLPSPWTLSGKVIDLKYAEFHSEPTTECMPPTDNMIWKSMNISNSTFAIILEDGVVNKIMLKNNISTWEANYIRSVVSQLQIDLQRKNEIERTKFNKQYQDEFILQYSTMEESVIGQCETVYNISPLPEHVLKNKPELAPLLKTSERHDVPLDIIKTINFNNCKQHVVYHKGMKSPKHWDAGDSNVGDATKRSVEARFIINGTFDNYTMQSSVIVEKMLVSASLYRNEKAMIGNCMNLTIQEMKRSVMPPVLINGTESYLIYDYEYKTTENVDNKSKKNNNTENLRNPENQPRNTRYVHFQKRSPSQRFTLHRRVRHANIPRPEENITLTTESPDTTTTISTISPDSNVTLSTLSPDGNITMSTVTADENSISSTTLSIISTTDINNRTSSPIITTSSTLSPHDSNGTVTTSTFRSISKVNESLNLSVDVHDSHEKSGTEYLEVNKSNDDTHNNKNANTDNINMTTFLKSLNISNSLQQPHLTSLFSVYPNLKNRSMIHKSTVQNAIKVICENIGRKLLNFQSVVNENTLHDFSELTFLIGNAEYEILHHVSTILYVPQNSSDTEQKMSWIVFRDAVVQTGSGPSLMLIKEWILYNKTKDNEAAEILSTLYSTVETPNELYVDTFFDLVKHPQISSQQGLNVTALLTFTKIICNAFVDVQSQKALYPVHVFSPLVRTLTKLEGLYLPYLVNKLNTAMLKNETENIYAYVRALGNVAHPKILNIFNNYMKNTTDTSIFVKHWMVICLDKIVELYPSETRHFLYSLYIDLDQQPDIRTASVFQIMKSKPPANVIQKIAEMSKYDTSNQVIAAVQSSMHSAAHLNHPDNSELKNRAYSALHLLNNKNLGIQYSHFLSKYYEIPQFANLAYSTSLSYYGSGNHILPKGYFIDYEKYLGGLSSGKEHYGLLVSDIKKIDTIFKKIWNIMSYNEAVVPKDKSSDEMQPKLNLNITDQRNDNEDRLKAILMFQLAKYEKFVTINKDISSITKYIKQLLKTIKGGYKFNYTKLFNRDNFILSVPNVAGHITQMVYKVPSIYRVTGKIKLNTKRSTDSDNSQEELSQDIYLSGKLNIGYSFDKYTDIGLVTPFNGHRYNTGYKEQLLINVPLKVNITFATRSPWIESQITLSPYSDSATGIHCQFKSQQYQQNDTIYDIVTKKSARILTDINKQQKIQTIKKFGSLLLNITNVSLKKQNVFPQENDFFSIFNSPANENNQQNNNNIILKADFPRGVNSVSLRMRYANMDMKTPKAKKSNKPIKQQKSSGVQGNNTFISEWSVLYNHEEIPIFAASMNYSWSPFSNNTNLKIVILKESQEQLKLMVNGTWAKTPIFNATRAFISNPKSEVNASLHLGSSKLPIVSMQCTMQKTFQRKQFLKNQFETKDCIEQMQHGNFILPSCQITSERANYLDYHNCSINMEGLNDKGKIYKKFIQLFNTLMYDNFMYKPRKTPSSSNQLSFSVQFTPSFQSADVFISSPNTDLIFKNISIPSSLRPLFEIHPSSSAATRIAQSLLSQQYNPVCVLDKYKINTYDNKTYPIKFGSCWHILMALSLKDKVNPILQENDILILVRDMNEERVVRVMIGENIVDVGTNPHTKHSSVKYIYVNNMRHQISQENYTDIVLNSENNIILQSRVVDENISLDLYNKSLKILFDGLRVMVSTSNKYRNQTLGLCGTFNGEDMDDFTVPNKNCKISNSSFFTASYAIVTNNTCSGEALEMAQKAINMSCSATNDMHTETQIPSVVSCAENDNREPDPRCITNYIQVLQDHKHTCFSQKKIPKCKSSCFPTEVVQKKVSFHCVSTNAVSEQFAKAILSGNIHDFSQKQTTKQILLDIPNGCSKC